MGEGTLAEVRGESEKRVNVSEFISVEPKLGAERGVHNERKRSTSLLLKIDRAERRTRVLNARRFASGLNFEKELHGQYTIHRRMIPLA